LVTIVSRRTSGTIRGEPTLAGTSASFNNQLHYSSITISDFDSNDVKFNVFVVGAARSFLAQNPALNFAQPHRVSIFTDVAAYFLFVRARNTELRNVGFLFYGLTEC